MYLYDKLLTSRLPCCMITCFSQLVCMYYKITIIYVLGMCAQKADKKVVCTIFLYVITKTIQYSTTRYSVGSHCQSYT